MTEMNPELKQLFLYCILHQEVLLVGALTKVVNLISKSYESQALLEWHDSAHSDFITSYSCQTAHSGQRFQKGMGPEERDTRVLSKEMASHDFLLDAAWMRDLALPVGVQSQGNCSGPT